MAATPSVAPTGHRGSTRGAGAPSAASAPLSMDLQAREFAASAEKVDMALEFMGQNGRSLDTWLGLRVRANAAAVTRWGDASTEGSAASSGGSDARGGRGGARDSQGRGAGAGAERGKWWFGHVSCRVRLSCC